MLGMGLHPHRSRQQAESAQGARYCSYIFIVMFLCTSLEGCILLKQDLYHASVEICLCRAEGGWQNLEKERLYNTKHIVDTE